MPSSNEPEDKRPTVSVVVPVYNDPDGITLTLESVTNQTYPTDQYEILVVDNDSTDNTRDVVRDYTERYPELIRLLVEDEMKSPAAARNKGIENASGSIFAFIDADMTVDESWLESVTETLQNGGHNYMGCTVETYIQGRETLAAKYDRLFAFPMEGYIRESKFAGTGCLVVRKNVFDTVGLFDSELISSEDREFGQRVHEAGFDQHFEPSITMYHPVRSSVVKQVKKDFRIGRGARQLHEAYPERSDARSPFRLRSYLPPNPSWFHSEIDDKTIDSTYEMAGLYLIACLRKFFRTAGSLYEYFGAISTTRR